VNTAAAQNDHEVVAKVPGLGNCFLHAAMVERLLPLLCERDAFTEMCVDLFGDRNARRHAASLATVLYRYMDSGYDVSLLLRSTLLDELTLVLREHVVDVMDCMEKEGFCMFRADYRGMLRRDRQWFSGPCWTALSRIVNARVRVKSFEGGLAVEDLFYHKVPCASSTRSKEKQQTTVQNWQVPNRDILILHQPYDDDHEDVEAANHFDPILFPIGLSFPLWFELGERGDARARDDKPSRGYDDLNAENSDAGSGSGIEYTSTDGSGSEDPSTDGGGSEDSSIDGGDSGDSSSDNDVDGLSGEVDADGDFRPLTRDNLSGEMYVAMRQARAERKAAGAASRSVFDFGSDESSSVYDDDEDDAMESLSTKARDPIVQFEDPQATSTYYVEAPDGDSMLRGVPLRKKGGCYGHGRHRRDAKNSAVVRRSCLKCAGPLLGIKNHLDNDFKNRKGGRHTALQNRYLETAIFTAQGNYAYCKKCCHAVLGVGNDRLASLRKGLAAARAPPTRKMAKHLTSGERRRAGVGSLRLSRGDPERLVVLPRSTHPLVERPSNRSKRHAVRQFKAYVLANSEPSGRRKGCKHWLSSEFRSVAGKSRRRLSLHAGFSLTIHPEIVSRSFVRRHFRRDFPGYSIAPSKTDYCDRCVDNKKNITLATNKLKAARTNSSVHTSRQQAALLQVQLRTAVRTQANHLRLVKSERVETDRQRGTESTRGLAEAQYKLIRDLYDASEEESWTSCALFWLYGPTSGVEVPAGEDIPTAAKALFDLEMETYEFWISIDFKKNASMFHWGRSDQPGQSYYMSMLNIILCGVMSHHVPANSREGRHLYWWYKPLVGPKNGDHLLSIILDKFMAQGLPEFLRPCLRRLKVCMDGARSTNWTQGHARAIMYVVADPTRGLREIGLLASVAGHSKCVVDRMLSLLGCLLSSDLFLESELLLLFSGAFDNVTNVKASDVLNYREATAPFFPDLAGIASRLELKVFMKNGAPVLAWRESQQHPFVNKTFGPSDARSTQEMVDAVARRIHNYADGPVATRSGMQRYPMRLKATQRRNFNYCLDHFFPPEVRQQAPWKEIMALEGGAEEAKTRECTIPSELSIEEIGDLLETAEYDLEACRYPLEAQGVDGERFVSLTRADVVEMGIKRRFIPRLLEAVEEMAAECPQLDPGKKAKKKKKKGRRRDASTQAPECVLPMANTWAELLQARGGDGCATVIEGERLTVFSSEIRSIARDRRIAQQLCDDAVWEPAEVPRAPVMRSFFVAVVEKGRKSMLVNSDDEELSDEEGSAHGSGASSDDEELKRGTSVALLCRGGWWVGALVRDTSEHVDNVDVYHLAPTGRSHGAYRFANRRQVFTVPRSSIFYVFDFLTADMDRSTVSGKIGWRQFEQAENAEQEHR
jgi:hypothetical protein